MTPNTPAASTVVGRSVVSGHALRVFATGRHDSSTSSGSSFASLALCGIAAPRSGPIAPKLFDKAIRVELHNSVPSSSDAELPRFAKALRIHPPASRDNLRPSARRWRDEDEDPRPRPGRVADAAEFHEGRTRHVVDRGIHAPAASQGGDRSGIGMPCEQAPSTNATTTSTGIVATGNGPAEERAGRGPEERGENPPGNRRPGGCRTRA